MAVAEDAPLADGYKLKLNSYDLGVDLELADAVERLRFEHPEVRAVVITGGMDRVFCAGANIHMLASSPHGFKVNFCKFTNETRLAIEEASARSGQRYIAACNGTAAGGGYELALACESILLVDDGSSAVSLPEVPLLGVLPGTGGLTRVTDKRRVRRDLADVFATLPEGVKGRRAVEWGLVDEVVPRSRFRETVRERAEALAGPEDPRRGPAIALEPIGDYRHVDLRCDAAPRVAELLVHGPEVAADPVAWALRAFREIDRAVLRLRFEHEDVGVVLVKTRGDLAAARAAAGELHARRGEWLVNEVLLLAGRALRRLEATSKSLYAIVDGDSCFAGALLELALAADRIYMLDQPGVALAASPLNGGALACANGRSRLDNRFPCDHDRVARVLAADGPIDAAAAREFGLATATPDAIDWDDEVRVAIEERASLSPDALTAMEANLRAPVVETLETRIFGRLSAWQNWVFSRPNATGDKGALALYGKPERPRFDWRRT